MKDKQQPRGLGIADLAEALKLETVWRKGHLDTNLDPRYWRRDDFGHLIQRSAYGDQLSPYGWQLDHYPVPKALGGRDDASNLRPLHHRRNASLGGILGGLMDS